MICRLCLEDAEHGVPIFGQEPPMGQPAHRQLAELIERHLLLVVSGFGLFYPKKMFFSND